MLRDPPSLFGGWDSDRPWAVAATLKGITGIGGDNGYGIPGAGGNPGLVGSCWRLTVCYRRRMDVGLGLELSARPATVISDDHAGGIHRGS